MQITLAEIKYAFRMLRKAPGLSLLAIVALAFGLGLTTAAFSVVHGIFMSELPFPDAERIVAVFNYHRAGRYNVYVSGQEFQRRAAQAQSFEALAAYYVRNVLIGGEGRGSVARGAYITSNSFQILQVRAALGRGPLDRDGQPGAAPVVILSHHLWRARFGGDESIIGRTVVIAGETHAVAGIMPEGFRFPEREDLWIPISIAEGDSTAERLNIFGKLRRGVTFDQAESEMAVIDGQQPRPRYKPGELIARVRPYTRSFADDEEQLVFAAVVGGLVLLLLVAAANVANLLLARNAARGREMAVRAALGASRSRLVTQLVLEALLLCGVAAVLGYAGASAALAWIISGAAKMPFWVKIGPNPAVLGFMTLLVLLATAVAGIAPALKTTRVSVMEVLKQGSTRGGLRFGRLSAGLIVAEFAIAVGFIGTAATLGRGLLGLDPARELPASEVLISQIYYGQPPKLEGVSDRIARREIWREFVRESGEKSQRIEEMLRGLPGVRGATTAWYFPGSDMETIRVQIGAGDGAIETATSLMQANANYFDLLGARLLAGRMFTASEYTEPASVALVNESFARRHFAGKNPLGAKIRILSGNEGAAAHWAEIVGVAPDLALNPADPSRADGVYVPLAPSSVVRVAVRTSSDPRSLIPAVHEVVQREAPAAQVQWSVTLEENIAQTTNMFHGLGGGLLALGGIAMLLSAASMYAIVAFSVTQRTREIGIRVALGAEPRHVLHALLRRQVAQLLCGAAIGAALSAGFFQMVKQLPFPMEGTGIWTSATLAAILLAAGLVACLIPARRALKIQPMEALRYE